MKEAKHVIYERPKTNNDTKISDLAPPSLQNELTIVQQNQSLVSYPLNFIKIAQEIEKKSYNHHFTDTLFLHLLCFSRQINT